MPAPTPPPVVNIGGGGGSGGSSGSSSGGGSSAASAAAAKKARAKERKRLRRHYRIVLRSFGLAPGQFQKLIKFSAKKKDSDSDFLQLVSETKKFKLAFPGFGELQTQLGSFEQAIGAWQATKEELTQGVAQAGLGGLVTVDAALVGAIIKGNTSPAEALNRILVQAKVSQTQETKDDFVSYLNEIGQGGLAATLGTAQGWTDFVAGEAGAGIYDLYEGVQLRSQGFSAEQANAIAKAFGVGGEAADLSSLPDAIKLFRADAGQELDAAGVSDQDLMLIALSKSEGATLSGTIGTQAKEKAMAVEQILANREARKKVGVGVSPTTFGGRPLSGNQRPLEESL